MKTPKKGSEKMGLFKKNKITEESNIEVTAKESLGYFKNNRSIIGGILGDRDKRTKRAINTFLFFLLATFLTVSGIIMFFYQYNNYTWFLVNNTTPIGTELKFSRTGATVSISDVWTDKERDLTVVKLNYSGGAYQVLSTNGSNYNLYLATKLKDRPENLTMSFGMLSTDGDAFLFIKGRLDERAYQIFIANQLDLVSANSITDDSDANINKNESITKSLSQYSMNTVDSKGVLFFKDNTQTTNVDNINFRINPFSSTTNVYQGSFLNDKGEIDYSKVVAVTSTKTVLEKLRTTLEEKKETVKKIDSTMKEYRERLESNPEDSNSIENIKQLETKKQELETDILKTQETLTMYEEAEFDQDSFGKMKIDYQFLNLDQE